jgi:type IV secretory pathway VirB2 component (pilin)
MGCLSIFINFKPMGNVMKNRLNKVLSVGVMFLIWSSPVFAATTGGDMPWSDPLSVIQSWLTGYLAHTALIITIAMSGLILAFGETGSVFRRIGGAVFGISMAAGATTVATALHIGGVCI